MTIQTSREGGRLTVSLEGRLDTATAPELEEALRDALSGVREAAFDFRALEYISSAGLRVLLAVQKKLTADGGGRVAVRGANQTVREILEVTGFAEILAVE